jgi:hypothetical protein
MYVCVLIRADIYLMLCVSLEGCTIGEQKDKEKIGKNGTFYIIYTYFCKYLVIIHLQMYKKSIISIIYANNCLIFSER